MENVSFISILFFMVSSYCLHLPKSILKDTIRKYKRMKYYNPELAKIYIIENGSFEVDKKSSFTLWCNISSLLLAPIPLILAFGKYWIIIIIANTLFSYILTPFLAFFIIPTTSISSKKILVYKAQKYLENAIFYLAIGLIWI